MHRWRLRLNPSILKGQDWRISPLQQYHTEGYNRCEGEEPALDDILSTASTFTSKDTITSLDEETALKNVLGAPTSPKEPFNRTEVPTRKLLLHEAHLATRLGNSIKVAISCQLSKGGCQIGNAAEEDAISSR